MADMNKNDIRDKNVDNADVRKSSSGKLDKKAKAKRKSATDEVLVCPPNRAGTAPAVRIAGMVCRMLIIFTAVFGLVFFLCDALRLAQQEIVVSAGYLALISLIFVAIFTAMSTSVMGLIGGGAVLIGGVLTLLLTSEGVAELLRKTFLTAKNVALTRLFNLGYYGMSRYISEVSYADGYGAEYYMHIVFGLVAAVVALVFTLSCIKRVHIAGPVIISAVIIGVVFTYNISRSNWGTVLIIASFVGIIAMHTYDCIFQRRSGQSEDKNMVLFADDDRPQMPEGVLTPEAARLMRRQKRREERELRRRHKKNKTQMTVEEELDSYFGASVKGSAPGRAKKSKLTPEERRQRKETTAQARRVARYDSEVAAARRAHGGFAAIGAFIMAMLVLLLPALTVTGSFTTIDAIDKKMEYYREYVTALLMGDDPILDELGYQNDKNNFIPHSADATPRYYTGKKLMTIETQYAANVYLRGWIGTSYSNGAWNACSDDELDAYRQLYGTTIDPNERLFDMFYSILDPSVTADKDFTTSSISKLKYGFVAMQVNVKREKSEDAYVYMPSFYRVNETVRAERANAHGLVKYGTSEADDETTFVNYFDGIYTGRRFMSELSYASVAYVTLMRTSDWYRNVASLIAQFNEGYNDAYDEIAKYASRRTSGKSASLDNITKAIFTEQPENIVAIGPGDEVNTKRITVDYPRGRVEYIYSTATGEMLSYKITQQTEFSYVDEETGEVVKYTLAFAPTGIDLCTRYRELMTPEQKNELAYAYYWQYLYENFAYETYLSNQKDISKTVSQTLSEIANAYDADNAEKNGYKLIEMASKRHSDSAQTYEARHRLVMEIVDYLKETCTYNLTPTSVADPTLDGIDNFLSVTHEGYCTQYASALALMLRAAGIPARYVEGYVACDFVRNGASDAVGRYVTTVRDYNAHSWVEVWFDGIGWVQYEATPVYYDDMYTQRGGSQSGGNVRPWYDPEDEESEEQQLLDSVKSELDTAQSLIELYYEDMRLLVGGASMKAELADIESILTPLAERWTALDAEYQANKDTEEYSTAPLMMALMEIRNILSESVMPPLEDMDARIEQLKQINTIVRNIAIALAVLAVVIIVAVIVSKRAKRAERARRKLLASVEDGQYDPEKRRETAKSVIEWLTALLAAYGSSPKTGEFRAEYAKRLENDYLGVFGKPDSPEQDEASQTLVSDTDFTAIFDAIAAEEFGNGMSEEQLREVAIFCRRMREAARARLSCAKRLYYHFIKKII